MSIEKPSEALVGYLRKRGPGIKAAWKTRWFELRGNEFHYFAHQNDTSSSKGSIELTSVFRVTLGTEFDGKKIIELHTPGRKYILSPIKGSEHETLNWIKRMNEWIKYLLQVKKSSGVPLDKNRGKQPEETSSSNNQKQKQKLLEGFLKKKSDHLKSWRSRWFKQQDIRLMYYKSREDPECLGVIELNSIDYVATNAVALSFDIHMRGNKVFSLRADTKNGFEKWVNGLQPFWKERMNQVQEETAEIVKEIDQQEQEAQISLKGSQKQPVPPKRQLQKAKSGENLRVLVEKEPTAKHESYGAKKFAQNNENTQKEEDSSQNPYIYSEESPSVNSKATPPTQTNTQSNPPERSNPVPKNPPPRKNLPMKKVKSGVDMKTISKKEDYNIYLDSPQETREPEVKNEVKNETKSEEMKMKSLPKKPARSKPKKAPSSKPRSNSSGSATPPIDDRLDDQRKERAKGAAGRKPPSRKKRNPNPQNTESTTVSEEPVSTESSEDIQEKLNKAAQQHQKEKKKPTFELTGVQQQFGALGAELMLKKLNKGGANKLVLPPANKSPNKNGPPNKPPPTKNPLPNKNPQSSGSAPKYPPPKKNPGKQAPIKKNPAKKFPGKFAKKQPIKQIPPKQEEIEVTEQDERIESDFVDQEREFDSLLEDEEIQKQNEISRKQEETRLKEINRKKELEKQRKLENEEVDEELLNKDNDERELDALLEDDEEEIQKQNVFSKKFSKRKQRFQ